MGKRPRYTIRMIPQWAIYDYDEPTGSTFSEYDIALHCVNQCNKWDTENDENSKQIAVLLKKKSQ